MHVDVSDFFVFFLAWVDIIWVELKSFWSWTRDFLTLVFEGGLFFGAWGVFFYFRKKQRNSEYFRTEIFGIPKISVRKFSESSTCIQNKAS